MIIVKLTTTELALAAHVGIKRWEQATNQHREDSVASFSIEDSMMFHIQGAAGELAAGRALGLYVPLHIGEYRNGAADLGYGLEVRYTPKETNSLLLRPWDKEERIYILVRGKLPEVHVVGWIRGTQAKVKENWAERGNALAGYFVNDTSLNGIGELKTLILDYLRAASIREVLHG